MAGALSESAPKPVSVVRVEAEPAAAVENNQQPVQLQETSSPAAPAAPSATPSAAEPISSSTVSQESSNALGNVQLQQQPQPQPVRSYASTEAQTEQLSPGLLGCSGAQHQPSHAELLSEELRDARRRERRMRRQHRRAIQRANGAAAAAAAAAAVNGACAAAAGLPPTYPGLMGPSAAGALPTCAGAATTLHQPSSAAVASAAAAAAAANAAAAGVPLVGPGPTVGGFLHPPPPHLGLRGLSLGLPFPVPASVSAFGRDAVPKQCCGLGSPPVRWSILGVGVVGLVCAGAGALLGALRATGRDHIAVALLMIGIGVVLVTVSAVAWRVTSRENCAGFFGLAGISGRIPPARPMHPYAAMIYPEFQFRTPPPSYQASMQEYRLRLLLLDRLQPTSSPPPTYRSNAGSCAAGAPSALHQPLNGSHFAAAVAAVHHHHHHHQSANAAATSRESRPPSYCGHRAAAAAAAAAVAGPLMASSGQSQQGCSLLVPSKKDANLVRIVQTESDPVILSGDQTPPVTAVEVLAHL